MAQATLQSARDATGGEPVRVGVGILVLKDGKVLLGKRKSEHGRGQYGGVGGHLEYGETLEQAALRELREECGITVKNMRLLCVSDLFSYRPRHYVDVGFVAEWAGGEPEVLEPHKLEKWEWHDIDHLPEELFGTEREYIQAYKTGQAYLTVDHA